MNKSASIMYLFVLTLLFITSAMAENDETFNLESVCGIEGSVEERIKDCNYTKLGFVLVARTEAGIEVHKDLKTGLLWSDRVPGTWDHFAAPDVCKKIIKETAGIAGLTWRLPTRMEYILPGYEGRDLRKVLPNMPSNHEGYFWSSTRADSNNYEAYGYYAQWGGVWLDYRFDELSVRCVAQGSSIN